LAAVWFLGEAGIDDRQSAMRAGLAAARWPGRFERATAAGGTTIVLDGAHSPGSAAALAAALTAEEPDRTAVLVLGTMADKDAAAILAALAPVGRSVVATAAHGPRAASPELVAAVARDAGFTSEPRLSVAEAVARAVELAGADGLVLITGSLAVVAEAREALGLARPDPPIGAP
jgi:dihydrofolate synthase/folylpolyglutamate synthase